MSDGLDPSAPPLRTGHRPVLRLRTVARRFFAFKFAKQLAEAGIFADVIEIAIFTNIAEVAVAKLDGLAQGL